MRQDWKWWHAFRQNDDAVAATIACLLYTSGDSLTFGEQSGGQLGDPTATAPGISALPGAAVPPTQENGFWSLLYQQYAGKNPATTGVLPLIVKPGLGAQLVVSTLNAGFAATHLGLSLIHI